jgi:CO/xanthine dehydrogenase FAD-binding subunit
VKRAVETLDDINPIPSIHGSPWYKRRIAKIILRDVLLQCAERARIRPS